MDWTTVIVSLLSGLLSGGGLAGLVFFKENKRNKQLQNETMASSQWKDLYEKSEAKVEAQGKKIDSLYKDKERQRDQIDSLKTQKAVLVVYKCKMLGCALREPPFGCENTGLIGTKNKEEENNE